MRIREQKGHNVNSTDQRFFCYSLSRYNISSFYSRYIKALAPIDMFVSNLVGIPEA